PQLEALHEAVFLIGHFRVDVAGPGSRPLHAAGPQRAGVALIVAVAHAAGEHIGHRLEPPVRVLGKAGEVVGRIVRAELVEQQERIELRQIRAADDAVQLDAGAVARRHAANEAPHLTGPAHAQSPGRSNTSTSASLPRSISIGPASVFSASPARSACPLTLTSPR